VWTEDESRAICARAEVGRYAVGVASGHAGLHAARIRCRHCGIRTEGIEFADAKARITRRLRQEIGVDCPQAREGMRHDAMLLLKLKWATARPIRSARDLGRFLQPQRVYSNR
jgi:hypothetical protein